MPPAERVTKRHGISDIERRQIRLKHREFPEWTQTQLAKWAAGQFRRPISQSTICDSLKDKFSYVEKRLSRGQRSSERRRVCQYPVLEDALFDWHQQLQSRKIPITGRMIQHAASAFWDRIEQYSQIKKPAFSGGWLERFKKRHGIQKYKRHGESGSAEAAVEAARGAVTRLIGILKQYSSDDTYNCDESALFYKLLPETTLATEPQSGMKKEKARVTIHACTNASGTHKLPLWVIGTAANPRVFGKKNARIRALDLVWKHNQKGWMTTKIMLEWLSWFDRQVAPRNVLLLMDNFSAHEAAVESLVVEAALKNVRVEFLPPNTTSFYQPLDQGIIANLKAYYRRYWLDFFVEHMIEEPEKKFDIAKETTLLHALQWLVAAWQLDVSEKTINNCWTKTGLWGARAGPEKRPVDYVEPTVINDLETLVNQLEQAQSIEKITDIPILIDPPEEQIQDTLAETDPDELIQNIAAIYSRNPTQNEDDLGEQVADLPKIKYEEAIEALYKLHLFEEQSTSPDQSFLPRLIRHERTIHSRRHAERTKQTLISHFFQKKHDERSDEIDRTQQAVIETFEDIEIDDMEVDGAEIIGTGAAREG